MRALAVVVAVALVGCSRKDSAPVAEPAPKPRADVVETVCAGVNEQDLGAVVRCYYAAKTKKGKFRFLSKASQEQTSQADFETGDSSAAVTATVLGEEARSGTQYARVSLHADDPTDGGCSETWTQTWVREAEGWRTVRLARSKEVMDKQFAAGDYQSYAATAESMLKSDPFSIVAYVALRVAAARGVRSSLGGPAALVQAALGINPGDSNALFAAVTGTKDPEVAGLFLAKMARDDCWRAHALFNLAIAFEDDGKRLALLEAEAPSYPAPILLLQRAGSLTALRRKDDVRQLLSSTNREAIEKYLSRVDPVFAAASTQHYARCLLLIDDLPAARAVTEAALMRSPDNKELAALYKELKAVKPK